MSFTGTSVTYTPATNYTGSDSFTYTISDGQGGASVGTVSVTVANNTAPTAVDDSLMPIGQQPGSHQVGYAPPTTMFPLMNDTDPDSGQTLTITGVTQGAYGTVTFNADSVTYTDTTGSSTGGFSDSFTYTISDGNGGTDTATVAVEVTIEPPW